MAAYGNVHGCKGPGCNHRHCDRKEAMLYLRPPVGWLRAALTADEHQWNELVNSGFIDMHSLYYLLLKRVANWCTQFNTLYPVRVTGDGNCLMNAVSMYMVASQDYSKTLRNAVHQNMAEYPIAADIRMRWQHERDWQNCNIPDGGLHFTHEEWDREWQKVVEAAVDTPHKVSYYNTPVYEYLEEIHVFVLANILLRPIIIVAEPFMCSSRDGTSIEQNNLIGIYLPLLCPPDYCHHVPVVLAFIVDHFMPLMLREFGTPGSSDGRTLLKDVVPLVTVDLEPMRIHFLLPDEEGAVANVLLQQYLIISEEEVRFPDSTQIVLCALIDNDERFIMSVCGLKKPASVTGRHDSESSYESLSPLQPRAVGSGPYDSRTSTRQKLRPQSKYQDQSYYFKQKAARHRHLPVSHQYDLYGRELNSAEDDEFYTSRGGNVQWNKSHLRDQSNVNTQHLQETDICCFSGCHQKAVSNEAAVLHDHCAAVKAMVYCRDSSRSTSVTASGLHYCYQHAALAGRNGHLPQPSSLEVSRLQSTNSHHSSFSRYSPDDAGAASLYDDGLSDSATSPCYLLAIFNMRSTNNKSVRNLAVLVRAEGSVDFDSTGRVERADEGRSAKAIEQRPSSTAERSTEPEDSTNDYSDTKTTTDVLNSIPLQPGTGLCLGPNCSRLANTQLRGLCNACYRKLLNVNFDSLYTLTREQH